MRADRHRTADQKRKNGIGGAFIPVKNGTVGKIATLILAGAIILAMVIMNIQSSLGYSNIKALIQLRDTLQESDEVESTCEDLIIIGTGQKKTKHIKKDWIKDVSIVHFNDADKRCNVISMPPDTFVGQPDGKDPLRLLDCYDRKEPEKFCAAINNALNTKTEYYATINTKDVHDMVDVLFYIYMDISENEKNAINEQQGKLAEEYGWKDEIQEITWVGKQKLNGLQAATYAQMKYGSHRKQQRRFGRVVRQILKQVNRCNVPDMQRIYRFLVGGDNNLDSDYLIQAGARIQSYEIFKTMLWPDRQTTKTWNGERYVLPVPSFKKCGKLLYKVLEEPFVASDNVKKQDKYRERFLAQIEAERQQRLQELYQQETENSKEKNDKKENKTTVIEEETEVEDPAMEKEPSTDGDNKSGGDNSGGGSSGESGGSAGDDITPDTGGSGGGNNSGGDTSGGGEVSPTPDSGGIEVEE